MNAAIKQKFEVLGEYFDTCEEAEAYLAENKDQARVDAFMQHLRDNGAKRIATAVPTALLQFIQFENGTLVVDPEDKEPEQSEKTSATAEDKEPEQKKPTPSVFDQVEEETEVTKEPEPEEDEKVEDTTEASAAVMEQAKSTTERKSLFAN